MPARAVLAPSILSAEGLQQIESALAASSQVSLMVHLEGILSDTSNRSIDLTLQAILKMLVARSDFNVAILSKRDLRSLEDYVGLKALTFIAYDGLEIEGSGRKLRNPDADSARKELRCLCLQLKLALADLGDVSVEEGDLSLLVRLDKTSIDMRELIAQRSEEAIRARNFFAPFRTANTVEARLKSKGYAGWAARCVLRSLPPDTLSIYLGDHLTVQNIRDATGDGITIEVGNSLSSAAQFALPDTAAVGRFLSWLEHAKPHASISNPLPSGERSALV